MNRKIKVLSIDGGGIRGIIPARLLQYIEETTGKPTCQMFDLIAGTSTGGILALGLTVPSDGDSASPKFTAKQMLDFYLQQGPGIFKKRLFSGISQLWESTIDPSALESALQNALGKNTQFKDAITPLLITSYDLHGLDFTTMSFVGSQPIFFSSEHASHRPEYNFLTWQVARATSAAPTYFPPMRISPLIPNTSYWIDAIDGGTVANNPAMCAWVEAKSMSGNANSALADYLIVSIGTGDLKMQYEGDTSKDKGKLGWIVPMIDILMDASSNTVDHQLKILFDSLANGAPSYYRLQPNLIAGQEDMADASTDHMNALNILTENYIDSNTELLREICNLLK